MVERSWRRGCGAALLFVALVVGVSLLARDQQPPPGQPPATQPPATQPPATQPPATQPPATQPPADQQQPTPTFRTGTDVVRVDVTVLDRKGLPHSTLTADDFEVTEDDVLQPITSFKYVAVTGHPDEGDELSLPIRSPSHAAAEAARDDVRVFLILGRVPHRSTSTDAAGQGIPDEVRQGSFWTERPRRVHGSADADGSDSLHARSAAAH